MLTVQSPATTTAITTLSALKTELNIKTDSEDDYLQSKIEQVTDEFADYLQIGMAADGTRRIARETLQFIVEPLSQDRLYTQISPYLNLSVGNGRPTIVLPRWPVLSVVSVLEGTNTLDPDHYRLYVNGVMRRLMNGIPVLWADASITVTFTAGWVMPGDPENDRTLPRSIEAAAFDYIKALRAARDRDPLVKSENVSGILETEYWVGQLGDEGSLPPNVASRLDRYRRTSIGSW